MPDFMVGDGIEIVLHVTQVGGAPPVFILEGGVPAERVVVALDLGLESAGAMNAQLASRRLLHSAVRGGFASRADFFRVVDATVVDAIGDNPVYVFLLVTT